MKKMFFPAIAGMLLAGIFSARGADTTVTLSSQQQKQLLDIEKTFLPRGDCGMKPLSECGDCSYGQRFHSFAKWLVSRSSNTDSITNNLMDRRDCLTSQERASIDTAGYPAAGAMSAPVVIVGYMSAMCPVCKAIGTQMHHEVIAGRLKGKARFVAKPYATSDADKRLFAAARMNAFWPFVRALHGHAKEREDEHLFRIIADSLKLPYARFDSLALSPSVMRQIKSSREEAENNGVEITPTFFINNIRYHSYKDPRWLIDAAQLKYDEAVAGKKKP